MSDVFVNGTVEGTARTLRSTISGDVLVAGQPDYEGVRTVWNGVVSRHPALIVRCRSSEDAAQAVRAAKEAGLEIAVRGGGHSVAGFASTDGGMVIDLSDMNSVQVDSTTRIVKAEGGVTIGELDEATQAFGLAVPMGVVSATGIGGLTLGGGMGWLRRKYGLSCDALIGATVVTAEGRLVHVSETENADLLWGLRGGGGNFGIVTSFEYRSFEVGPDVAFNVTFYPQSEARKVFRTHARFMAGDMGEVSTLFALGRMPRNEHVPQEHHGRPFAAVLALYAGDAAEGWEYMRPLREVCEPLVDFSGIMPYLDAQRVFDEDYPNGMRYYWKSTSMTEISDDTLDLLVEQARRAPSDHTTIDVWLNGGKMSEVPEEGTAYGRRDIPYLVNGEANWEHAEDDQVNINWLRGCLAELESFGATRPYLNFAGFHEEGEAMTKEAYGGNYPRLVQLKEKYDPENRFHLNQNVRPATSDKRAKRRE